MTMGGCCAEHPLTNACDAGFFPTVAKVVVGMLGLYNRILYLSIERLWELLQRAWNEYPSGGEDTRFIVHQTQVAAAILRCNGGDTILSREERAELWSRKGNSATDGGR